MSDRVHRLRDDMTTYCGRVVTKLAETSQTSTKLGRCEACEVATKRKGRTR